MIKRAQRHAQDILVSYRRIRCFRVLTAYFLSSLQPYLGDPLMPADQFGRRVCPTMVHLSPFKTHK